MSSTLADKLKERRSRVDALRSLRNPGGENKSANVPVRLDQASLGDSKSEDATGNEWKEEEEVSSETSIPQDRTVEYKGDAIQKQIYEEAHAVANEGKDLSELSDAQEFKKTHKTNYDDNFKKEMVYYLYQEDIETIKRLNEIIENGNKV